VNRLSNVPEARPTDSHETLAVEPDTEWSLADGAWEELNTVTVCDGTQAVTALE
jgi:hypothetical protein